MTNNNTDTPRTDEEHRTEAAALMRGLIDKIVLTPTEHEGRKRLALDLHGDIAGILSMASESKKPPQRDGFAEDKVGCGGSQAPLPNKGALAEMPEATGHKLGTQFTGDPVRPNHLRSHASHELGAKVP